MDKRFLTTAAVCFAILFLWQTYIMPPPPKKTTPKPSPASAPTAPVADAPAAVPGGPTVVRPGSNGPAAFVEQLFVIDTPLYTAEVTTLGAALRQVTLKNYKEGGEKRGEEKHPVQLVGQGAGPLSSVVFMVNGQPVPFGAVAGATTPSFSARQGDLEITSSWKPSSGYTLLVSGAVLNRGENTTSIDLALAMNGLFNEGKVKNKGMFEPQPDNALPVFYDGSSMHRHALHKTDSIADLTHVTWAGLDRQYFLLAAAPVEPEAKTAAFSEDAVASEPNLVRMQTLLGSPAQKLAPGQSLPFRYVVYAGPKSSVLLREPGRGFEEVTEYSFLGLPLGFLARPMLWVLNRAHDALHNWGLAIIALTVLLKVLLFPVTARSFKSMQVMRELKPELDKIKTRFPDDREKQGVETMRLYRERKVNPFLSGCLPALLQLPIWVAMWRTIASAVELYQKDFLWLADLTAKDPYYILPLLSGVVTFMQQKISPPAGDPQQQKLMLYMMPPMFTMFMLSLPSGLVFYSLTNGVLTILQQAYITRRLATPLSTGAKAT